MAEGWKCRVCGCTDDDCGQCVEKTGEPCYWVRSDLCSACADEHSPTLTGSRGVGSWKPISRPKKED